MKVQLSQIEPNPFRRTKAYRLSPEKIEALRESIRSTDFWENVVARKDPADPEKIQLAYGHHRLAALRKEFAPDHEVNLIVKPLDDHAMFGIMARENLEEWGHDPAVLLETVRVCVDGYAKGLWDLRPQKPSAKSEGSVSWRFAPSFVPQRIGLEKARVYFDDQNKLPYTAETVARETGAPLWKVEEALKTLSLDEAKVVPESYTAGMTVSAAKDARDVLARVHEKTKSREVVERVARQIKKTVTGGRDARRETMGRIARKAITEHAGPTAIDYGALARRYAERLAAFFTTGTALFDDLKAIVVHADQVPVQYQQAILRQLRQLAAKATHIADRLEGAAAKPTRKLLKGAE